MKTYHEQKPVDINFQQMRYALEIARTGSISQAARNLYMNQPNLSKAVKELEQVLGITLFMRSSKGVIPTPEGRIFLESALDITDRVCQIREKLTDCREHSRTFNISIPRASYIAYAFTQFIALIPEEEDIHMNYQEANFMAAMENLLHHGFDLGIIRYPVFFEKDFVESLQRKALCSRELLEFEHVPSATRKDYQLVHRRCSGNTAKYKDIIIYRQDYHFTLYAKKFLHMLFQIIRSMQKNFD